LISGAPFLLEQTNDAFYVLGAVAVGHEHHVVGFDQYQIFHPQAVFAAQVAVTGVLVDHQAAQHVAAGVLIRRFPEGAPAAHIAPARLQGQHGAVVRLLHYRHVDRHAGATGEGLAFMTQKVEDGAGHEQVLFGV
jgi:hypothetical protein